MKDIYVKTLLYAYPNIQKINFRIDEIVKKKALSSMTNCTSCLEQCNKIVKLTMQKGILFEIKHYVNKILSRLDNYERVCVEYKYFKKKSKKDLEGVDLSSRSYFRKQKKIIEYLGFCFDWLNLSDKWFESKCRRVPYINKLYTALVYNESSKTQSKICKNVAKINKQKRDVA